MIHQALLESVFGSCSKPDAEEPTVNDLIKAVGSQVQTRGTDRDPDKECDETGKPSEKLRMWIRPGYIHYHCETDAHGPHGVAARVAGVL